VTSPDLFLTLGMALSVFIGALAQRATGMGFALLASPFLVLVLGPLQGVLVVNAASVLATALILTQVWRDVDRSRFLVPMGVVGIVPGTIAVALLPSAPLTIAISVLVLIGLGLTVMLGQRSIPSSPALAATGGFASGFMGVTAGVSGPGVVVYARATGWEHRSFAATAQLQGLVLGIVSLLAKWSLPTLSGPGWVALLIALGGGLAVGDLLSRRIDGNAAMRVVVVIAFAGAIGALVQGVLALA
jgi:uncharacterized membrane protein YfcA